MTKLSIILFTIMMINAALEINFSFRFAFERKPKMNTNYIVLGIFISSALWSFGAAMLSIQTEIFFCKIFRYIGMFGASLYVAFIQAFLCKYSGVAIRTQRILNGICFGVLIVFLIYVLGDVTVYVQKPVGMTFYLEWSPITLLFGVYFTIAALDIVISTLYMIIKGKSNRVKTAGKDLLIVEFLVFFGCYSDMIRPVLGYFARPGSSITHFWASFVLWFIIHGIYKSEITISNMSEYIYYSLGIPVLVFDSNYNLEIMNDAAALYFNRSNDSDSVSGLKVQNLFNVSDEIFNFKKKNTVVQARCLSNKANCELQISKINDGYRDTIGYIAIINDLTEHENVINELEAAKLAADSANLSKSLFLANMSHEIRTPMNAILGFSEIALMENIDDNSREHFTDIKQAGETLLSIINDILNISKIELGRQELNPSDYRPAKLFNDVNLIISMQAGKKGLKFEMEIAPNFPDELNGDADRIREILINLLNNSVKYTKKGGLKLEASIPSAENGIGQIQYKITDTGIGIKPEDIDSIFDKFQRVDAKLNAKTEGTGLGLSITKGLVDLMNGTIKVESIYGVGSSFTVTIPQKVVNPAPIRFMEAVEASNNKPTYNVNGKLFLAVDDNQINLKVVSSLLKRYDITHDLASSGPDAIELCKNKHYDIIFMDHMMPGMDGVEAMLEIRKIPGYEAGADAKIVALTANVIEGAKETLLESGFDSFLGKPINFKEFEKLLETYCK